MIQLSAEAHAKINLTLDVVGKRPDGYHDLRMVMQEISLGDFLTLTPGTGEPWKMDCGGAELPCDEGNLCVRAARAFFRETGIDPAGLTISLEKHTPVCAGMGGGSADGAAVLRLLWQHYGRPIPNETLFRLAEEVGSDVPFTLFGGTALAEGKGERLTRLPTMPDCFLVLCKPPFPVSTPELFSAIDREPERIRVDSSGMLLALREGSLSGVAASLSNAFTPLVAGMHPEILELRETMLALGALGAEMTGSGPTVFGVFREEAAAAACRDALKPRFAETFLARPIGNGRF